MTRPELRVLIEALTQFIDNQPEVDEPDPADVRDTKIAQKMLDDYERIFVKGVWTGE